MMQESRVKSIRPGHRSSPKDPVTPPVRWLVRAAIPGIVATMMALGSLAVVVAGPAGAGIRSDQSQASQLEQQIVAQGTAIQQLVSRTDQAQVTEAADNARLAADQVQLQADRVAQTKAASTLRRLALETYMTGASTGGSNASIAVFSSGSPTVAMARSEYAGLAANDLSNAIDRFKYARQRTAQAVLADQATANAQRAAVARLASDQQAAQAALTADQHTLAQVNGNLKGLLLAAQQQLAAQEQAAEEAMAARQQAIAAAAAQQQAIAEQQAAAQQAAAQQAAAQQAAASQQAGPSQQQGSQPSGSSGPAASSAPVNPAPSGGSSVSPAPGSYANPLRAISDLSPERIDQGVDYSGFGPIYAIGDGTVLDTVNSGWPGGTYIAYRLSDGPAAGLVVYAAEDIDPAVSVGQSVTANTVLGTMYEGPDGIETGWSDAAGNGETMAMQYSQFSGANSTAFGLNFSELLQSVGAPGGVLQNNPATGSLPANWPQW